MLTVADDSDVEVNKIDFNITNVTNNRMENICKVILACCVTL